MPNQHVVVHCGVNTLRLLPRKKQRTKLFREPRIESEKNVIKNVIPASKTSLYKLRTVFRSPILVNKSGIEVVLLLELNLI